MKVKMNHALGFDKVANGLASQKLPLPLAYKLAKLRSAMADDVSFYETRMKQLIELYAERGDNGCVKSTPDGKGIVLQRDKITECNEKIHELEEMMIDLPDTYFTIKEFGVLNLTLAEMELLLPFIKD